MSSSLDMSLDEIIKNSKKPGNENSSGRARGRGSGSRPIRRPQNRDSNRMSPYATAQAPEVQHNMYVYPGTGAGFPAHGSRENETKLYVSNLDSGVSNVDIYNLFGEVGDLNYYSVHYDESGKSKGTAEVVFSRRPDAITAIKRYDGVKLDGKPMKIEIVGKNIDFPAAPLIPLPIPAASGAFGSGNLFPKGGFGRGRAYGRPRSGGGGGGGRSGGRFGRGGGGRGVRVENITADDLDADLDKYHTEAKATQTTN